MSNEKPSEANRIPGFSMQEATESEQNLSIQDSGLGLFPNAQNVLITGGVFNIILPASTREEHMKIHLLQKPNSSLMSSLPVSSSQDMTLGPDHSLTLESDDDYRSWPMTTQMYSAESLHIQRNSYVNCHGVSPNEATQSFPSLVIKNNCSAPPPSPLYGSPPGTPTPASSSNRPGYTHRQQLQLFREAVTLISEGAGPFIPQPMYKPHTASDRKRYVEDFLLEAPVYFFMEHSGECGISLHDALHSRVKNLVNRKNVVFEGRGPSISIRLEWPGYRQWSRQIPTRDFHPPGPMTMAKLAKNVAKCIQRFMLDRKMLPMEDGSDEKWRIGDRPGDIKVEDLMLVSIHHVSLGSWQPQLRLRRPVSTWNIIPIRSSLVRSPTANTLFSF